MTTDPRHDARTALLDVTAARESLTGRARWLRPYFLALAAGSTAVVLTAGLAGLAATFVVTGAFLAVVAVLVVWAQHQGVVRRGTTRLHTTALVTWGVLYAAALTVGLNLLPGAVAFWVPAALVVAAPLLVAAVLAGRPVRAADPR